eukprot:1179822-Prorocentrum_minimum.AAC.5
MVHEKHRVREGSIYSLSPFAIGARYRYILSPLLRLVPATGVFSLPFCDWCPRRAFEFERFRSGGWRALYRLCLVEHTSATDFWSLLRIRVVFPHRRRRGVTKHVAASRANERAALQNHHARDDRVRIWRARRDKNVTRNPPPGPAPPTGCSPPSAAARPARAPASSSAVLTAGHPKWTVDHHFDGARRR